MPTLADTLATPPSSCSGAFSASIRRCAAEATCSLESRISSRNSSPLTRQARSDSRTAWRSRSLACSSMRSPAA